MWKRSYFTASTHKKGEKIERERELAYKRKTPKAYVTDNHFPDELEKEKNELYKIK